MARLLISIDRKKRKMDVRPTAYLQRFRSDFIQNFQRIRMNTTPGDAQFLRILVECSNAKNGLEIGVATGYGAT